MIRVRTTCFLLCLVFLALPGCSDETKPAPAVTPPPAGSAGAHLGRDTTAEVTPGSFSLRLIPEPLTAADPAQVLTSGCSEATTVRWDVNGQEIAGQTGTRLARDNYQRDDTVNAVVRCGSREESISVLVANSPPEILRVQFQDPNVAAGTAITMVPEAVDVDKDQLSYTYHWEVNGVTIPDVTDATLPGRYVHTGDEIALSVTPYDGHDEGELYTGGIFVVPNAPPKFVSQPPTNFRSEIYEYQVEAQDPDGEELSYQLEQAPPGMSLDPATHTLQWPLDKVAPGEYTVSILVLDPQGQQARQQYSITLSGREQAN